MSRDEYLVRGATLICTNGSHKRKLNLPKCHGVYATNHPLLHKGNHLEEWRCDENNCNITSFGICTPKEGIYPPTEIKTYLRTGVNSKDGLCGPVTGHMCRPEIIGDWRTTYEKTRIVDNGMFNSADRNRAKNASGRPIGEDTLTMQSFLICRYGGEIRPIDSGQFSPVTKSDFCNPPDYSKVMGTPNAGTNKAYEIDGNR